MLFVLFHSETKESAGLERELRTAAEPDRGLHPDPLQK